MGLLDFLNSPDNSLYTGLLAASGPSPVPVSFGQALMGGAQYANKVKQQQLDQQKDAMQMDMLKQQVAQITRKNNLINDFISGAMGGQQQAPTQTLPMGSADQYGRTINTPGFIPPSDTAPQQSGFGGVPSSAIAADLAFNNGGKIAEFINDRSKPTDFAKQLQQSGIDPMSPIGRQLMQAQVAKQNYVAPVNARPGSIIRDPYTQQPLAYNPHIPDGGMPQFDASGNVSSVVPLPGAADVAGNMARATAGGKNSVEPIAGVDGQGNPVFTNKTAAAGGFPSISPTQQASRNQDRLAILQQERQLATNPQDIAALDREIAAAQKSTTPQTAFGAVRPANPAGYNASQETLAQAGAKRFNDLINQASDSPTRVNVYDNILNLSKEGVATGPGQAWKNKVKGYAANTPLLGSVVGNWKDDVSGFQELNKFLYQNAQRNWQAAGGTGTDAQLEAFSKSNPNDAMFPKALQAMAQWGKAGELALQAKTNAMQNWKDQNGGNVANQDQFERAWRNNFDPVLFQLKTMDPKDAAAYVANLKTKNPNAYSNLLMKMQAMKTMGALQ